MHQACNDEANVAGDAFRRMEAADTQPGERGSAGLGVATGVAVNLSPTTTGIGTVSYRYRYKTVLFHTDMTRAYRSVLLRNRFRNRFCNRNGIDEKIGHGVPSRACTLPIPVPFGKNGI